METSGKYTMGHVFVAVLGGTALGAIAAFLLAPKSGRETRRQITGYFDDARNTLGRMPEAFRSATHAAGEVLAEHKRGNAHTT